MRFYTTDDDIHTLSDIAGKAQKSTTTVRVPLSALNRLIQDHANCIDAIEGRSIVHRAVPENAQPDFGV